MRNRPVIDCSISSLAFKVLRDVVLDALEISGKGAGVRIRGESPSTPLGKLGVAQPVWAGHPWRERQAGSSVHPNFESSRNVYQAG